jgi:glycosyltransferase involved in cell wall biosynthesis
MDLSVVIPVCTKEECIGTLINEITQALSDNYQHEIIVVDDGSTDNI